MATLFKMSARSYTCWHIICVLLTVLTSVQGNKLYSYDGDTSVSINTGTEVPFSEPVQFYGRSFDKAFISKDGLLGFSPHVRFVSWEWSNQGIPNPEFDLPFIAPFHYNGFAPVVSAQQYPGKIYYKLITRPTDSSAEEDDHFLSYLDEYLTNATVTLKAGFTSRFALRVTWENVSSHSNCSDDALQSGSCLSNTFQMVLAGNADHTIVIINYYKMDIPFSPHQLAGINGGDSRGWTDVVPCTGMCAKRSKLDPSRIHYLARHAGSEVMGRYILSVGGDTIVRGGCSPADLKHAEMEVYPRQAGMLGGEMLAVSGNCHPPGTKIYCRFGQNDQARSEGVMETSMRGRCPVPILTTRGETVMEISTDNVEWRHKTLVTIMLPSRLESPIDMTGIASEWVKLNPQELKVRWRSDLFSSNPEATLQINLIGYREDPSNPENPLVMKTLEELATGVLNSDDGHTIDPYQFTCYSQCDEFEVGLVQIRVMDQYVDNTTKYQAVNFGPVTLGWYVKQAMAQSYGTDWPAAKCEAWDHRDSQSTEWLDHLLPCPCTLSQALADWGRWQPDMGCNMFTGSVCTYHIDAKHCVRSVHPSPDGSGNQCCYEQDGNLRYAADTYQGSTPDRSHDWGSLPYGRPDHVPSLSHWIHDVVTFYYCCLWVEYRQCSYYMDRRATRDCKAYTPPHSATAFGDPHITTFDGKHYHFGGSGDFWLVKSDLLNIQGRFQERPQSQLIVGKQQLRPTNLTSVVMWIDGSDVVIVRKAPPGSPANRKLDIQIGGHRRFFEDKSQTWQDFKKVSIVNNGPTSTSSSQADKQHSNFTVLFHGGAGVQVAERQGLLHVVVVFPPNGGQTRGLLGTLDSDVTNEFTSPAGVIIPADAAEDVVYLDFSMKWNVSRVDLKFTWPTALEEKTPLFGDPANFQYADSSQKPSESQVRSTCRDSQSCRRDYYVTNDVTVARATKKTETNFAALQSSQQIVPTCGLLDIPMSEKTSTLYTEGSVVTVTGCRPDSSPVVSSGPLTYVCNMTDHVLQWSPEPDHNLCPHGHARHGQPEKASDVGMIIGIVVGVIAALVIVIVVLVILVRRSKSSGEFTGTDSASKPTPAKRTKSPADVVIEPGTDESLLQHKRPGGRGGVRMSDVQKSRGEESV